jgi:hypothetical protein
MRGLWPLVIATGVVVASIATGLAFGVSPRPSADCRIFSAADLQPNQSLSVHLSPGQRFVVAMGDSSWSVDIRTHSLVERALCPNVAGLAFRAKVPGSTVIRAVSPIACLGQSCETPGFSITVIIDNPAYRFDTAVPSSQYTQGEPTYVKVGTSFELVYPPYFSYLPWESLSVTDASILSRLDSSSPAGPGLAIFRARQVGESYLTAVARTDCFAPNINCYGREGSWEFFRMDIRVTPDSGLTAVLTDADSGRHLQLTVGQTVGIRLAAVPEELPVQVWPNGWPVTLYPIAARMGGRSGSLEKAFLAISTGEQEIAKQCNGHCRREFKVSITVRPRADGVAATISDLSGGVTFEVPWGSRFTVTLGPEMGAWSPPTTSPPSGLQPSGTAPATLADGAIVWTFIAHSAGKNLIEARFDCPAGRSCRYGVIQVQVLVVPSTQIWS